MPQTCIILGIETSCDETAAAVVRSGEQVLSNVVLSQFATHRPYGGVVPELASREHLKAIVPVTRAALERAGHSYSSIDALAVTQGPGLAGALLVGVSYAKTLAFALGKPLVAVNHLEGHIHAVLLEERQKGNHQVIFPALALVVSGGHTHLYLAQYLDLAKSEGGHWSYSNIGHTRDDAAGEAYDKVAKLLGLGYPGGPIIDALAAHGNPKAVRFTLAQIKHPERAAASSIRQRGSRNAPAGTGARFDFSYSGIKTAVLRYVEVHGMREAIERRRKTLSGVEKPSTEDYRLHCDPETLNLIASFQHAMVEDLVSKTLAAAQEHGIRTLLISGGVAANRELRHRFQEESSRVGIPVHFPSMPLSTDNAAMIAAAAYPKFLAGEFAEPELSAQASMPLG